MAEQKNEWVRILEALKPPVINLQTYDTWLAPTRFLSARNGTLCVGVPNREFSDYIEENLGPKITKALSSLGIDKKIVFQPARDLESPGPHSSIGTLASEIVPQQVSWLWPRVLPLGKLVIVEGDPGLGKSTLAIDFAARLSAGRRWPDSQPASSCPRGSVIVTAEDDLADTVMPRLNAAGARLDNILLVNVIREPNRGIRTLSLLTDLPMIREAALRRRASLVILDPLIAFVPPSVNTWMDQHVRQVLAPLASFAAEARVTVLCIRHLSKRVGGPAVYRGGGSIGFAGAARAVFLVGRDPEQPDSVRVFAPVKCNLSPSTPALRFSIENCAGQPRVIWKGYSAATSQALLMACDATDDNSATAEAKTFLSEILKDGPREAKEILRQAREAGIYERTLRRSKHEIRVRSFRQRDEWLWEMPPKQDGQI